MSSLDCLAIDGPSLGILVIDGPSIETPLLSSKLFEESEKYSDDEDADGTNHAEDVDGTNHSDLKLVKRGITRLYKFRMKYGNPGGIKIKRYFDVDLTVKSW
nr:hypothetical protein [Tanacetum cinerariifolium]